MGKYRIMWQYKATPKEIYLQYCNHTFSALRLYYSLRRKSSVDFVKIQKNY